MDQNKGYMVVLYQPKDLDAVLAKVVVDNYMNRHLVYNGTINGEKRILLTSDQEGCREFCQGYNYGTKHQSNKYQSRTSKFIR